MNRAHKEDNAKMQLRWSHSLAAIFHSFCVLVGMSGAVFAQAPSEARSAAQPPATKILFIGNGVTFLHGMPALLTEIAATASEPRTLVTKTVGFDAATLQSQWEKGDALAAIREGGWDMVVLQEHSHGAADRPEPMFRFARLFDAEIKKIGARTMIFQPWAWNDRYHTIVQIEANTRKISAELGAQLVPVGAAWKIAMKDFPRLPLLDNRAVPTPASVYLTATVFHAVITGRKPEPQRELMPGLYAIDAASLRSVAWEVAQAVK
ncbi:MAG: hypothetical protein JNN20_03490 [Betaproteobacteria bacterium]|nr:hypothetical protein [Betaproteobacteria bacterium]